MSAKRGPTSTKRIRERSKQERRQKKEQRKLQRQSDRERGIVRNVEEETVPPEEAAAP